MTSRKVEIARKTRETEISMTLDPDASDGGQVSTGLPFFDHPLQGLFWTNRYASQKLIPSDNYIRVVTHGTPGYVIGRDGEQLDARDLARWIRPAEPMSTW